MTRTELHDALEAAGWTRVERAGGRVDYYLVNSMVATILECDEALCQVREGYRQQMSYSAALAWAVQSRRARKCSKGCACKGCRRAPGGRLICR